MIASNRGGLPESCGGAAILLDPDDLSAVVQSLYKLATEPEYLTNQKRLSFERARRAPWSTCAEIVEQALWPVASNARPLITSAAA